MSVCGGQLLRARCVLPIGRGFGALGALGDAPWASGSEGCGGLGVRGGRLGGGAATVCASVWKRTPAVARRSVMLMNRGFGCFRARRVCFEGYGRPIVCWLAVW